MALGIVAFVHLGTIQASYGPLFGALQQRFAVGVAEVGVSVGANFLGGFFGVLLSSLLFRRLGYRHAITLATLLLGGGLTGVALSPNWMGVLVGAATTGFGYGVAVVLYNLLFARAFAPRGAAAVNLINAFFGVGAIVTPAFAAAVIAAQVAGGPAGIASAPPIVFGAIASLAVVVLLMLRRVPSFPAVSTPLGERHPAVAWPLLIGPLALYAGIFFLYVAVEVSTASWAPTHLERFVDPATAALAVSLFWGAMTLGRFGAAALGGRIAAGTLLLGSVSLALVGVLMTPFAALAFLGYALTGLGLGPVFPTTVVWLEERFGDATVVVAPIALASGNLGPVIGAPAIGLLVAALSTAAIPWVLAGFVALLLGFILAARLEGARRRG
jgi:fucose permease